MQILTADGKILTVYSDNIDEKTMDCCQQPPLRALAQVGA